MDYKQLQSFVEVVNQKSFSAAAEKLGISQPTISTHIKNLEEELKSRLLIRTARNLELTEKGRELFACAKNILKLWDDMVDDWNGKGRKEIQMGASTIPSGYILPEIIPDFGKKYDDIYFVVNQGDSQEIMDAVRKGTYDIGLVGMKNDEEELEFQMFYQDKLVVITPVNAHFTELKERGNVISAQDLMQESMILRESGSGSRKNAARLLEEMGIREDELRVAARVSDQEAIKNLVAGGLGISILSEKAVETDIAKGRMLSFELPVESAQRDLYIITQKDYILKNHIKVFRDYLLEHYEKGEQGND